VHWTADHLAAVARRGVRAIASATARRAGATRIAVELDRVAGGGGRGGSGAAGERTPAARSAAAPRLPSVERARRTASTHGAGRRRHLARARLCRRRAMVVRRRLALRRRHGPVLGQSVSAGAHRYALAGRHYSARRDRLAARLAGPGYRRLALSRNQLRPGLG